MSESSDGGNGLPGDKTERAPLSRTGNGAKDAAGMRLAPEEAVIARRKFLLEGVAPGARVPASILRSWERSAAQGLNMSASPGFDILSQHKLREAQQRNELLVRAARGEMEALARDVSESGGVVILTDPHGLVLSRLGHGKFANDAANVGLRPGAKWDEAAVGTNAIGTALAERQPLAVFGGEHFFERHSILSCWAAPIFDPRGMIAGVLDLTNASAAPQMLTLALVNRAAEQIERALFEAMFRDFERMHFHFDPFLVGGPQEGLLAFEGDRLVGANRNGVKLLGLDWPARGAMRFDELFTVDPGEVMENPASEDCVVQTKKGKRFFARIRPRPRARVVGAAVGAAAQEADLTLSQIMDRLLSGPFARLITVRRVRAGQIIFGADDDKATQEGLVIVRKGRLRCFASVDGKELTLFTLDPGDALPLTANSMFEAKKDGEVVVMSGKAFQEITHADPDLARSATPALGRMVQRSAQMTEDIVFRCVRYRFIRVLCEAAARDGRREADGVVLDAPPSAEEFAMQIGATRQSVSTIIAELIRDRLIRRLDASAIAIADLDRLKRELG